MVDLTHTLSHRIPSWNMRCGFNHEIKQDYQDCESKLKFRVQQLKMHAGIGTHIDSPSHCVPGAQAVESIPLETLLVPLIVIDVSEKMTEAYTIGTEAIHHFEKTQGPIQAGCFVAFYTGWS